VTNHGSATTITAILPGSSCAEFQASADLPVVLLNLDTLTITVTYAPNGRGPDICPLEIQNDSEASSFLGASGIGMASTLLVHSGFVAFTQQFWNTAVPETLHILCENIGNLPIGPGNFSAQLAFGTDFQLGETSLPIPAGAQGDIPLIFHPEGVGPRLDQLTLSVNNDLPADPDDVLQLYGVWNSTTAVPDLPRAPGGFQVGPSPTRGEVVIRYSAPRPGRVEVEVRDVAGRLVARRSRFALGSGPEAVTLRGPADWTPAPGVYLVRVSLEGEVLGTGRVVVVR